MFENRFEDIELVCSQTAEEGIEYINNTVKAVLIVSERMGQDLVPRLHDMENLMGVILFSENKWAVNYSKVKDEVNDFEKVIKAIDTIIKDSYKITNWVYIKLFNNYFKIFL